jgi:putative transposase
MSRQAYYQHQNETEKEVYKLHFVLELVKQIRKDHPRMGTRKMYHLIQPDLNFHKIKIGRDTFFNCLREEGLLIRKRKRYSITTNSNHWYRKHPNLIRGFVPYKPNQLWVSDITYIRVNKNHKYLFLLTDAYSRKIIGHKLSDNLESSNAIICLRSALGNICKPILGLIHHSDRGIQYCSNKYVNLLQDYGIDISMTENGDPLENAIAERVNGILKQEYIQEHIKRFYTITSLQMARIIDKYNCKRPHLSCNMLTPEKAHTRKGRIQKRWKNYYKKEVSLIN